MDTSLGGFFMIEITMQMWSNKGWWSVGVSRTGAVAQTVPGSQGLGQGLELIYIVPGSRLSFVA